MLVELLRNENGEPAFNNPRIRCFINFDQIVSVAPIGKRLGAASVSELQMIIGEPVWILADPLDFAEYDEVRASRL